MQTPFSRVLGLSLVLAAAGCGSSDAQQSADDAGDDSGDASTLDAVVDSTIETTPSDAAKDGPTGDTRGDAGSEASADSDAAEAGPPALGFPRLGGMLIGGPQNFDEVAYQKQIAKLDIAVLGMYNTWKRGGKTPATAISEIKALNPQMRLANYTIMTEANRTPDAASSYKTTKLSGEKGPGGVGDWWARDASGANLDWSGGAYGQWDTNLTLLTTADATGHHYPDWLADADYSRLLEGVAFDTWYCDNNFWRPRSNADWNRDGTNDSKDDVKVRNWWRDGQRAYYDRAHTIAPSLLVMGNVDSDLSGNVFPSGADKFSQYKAVLNAAFMEHAIGISWSAETWGGFKVVLDWYRELKNNLIEPRLILLDTYMASKTDYQTLRYGLALTSLDDGYFSASTNYNEIVWYDEYDLAGKGAHWLGAPLDAPPTAAYQKGVWRRRFANGMALVNPKGNGAQTVTIEAGYRKILGTQAPTINDGSKVTSVTLGDRDGILLVAE